MTITAVSSGSYRFAIESDFDTYIYVFDPRSARLMVNNTDYQDDYEDNYNPALEKELNAGVPYYVIVSAYNPGSITEISHLDLVITRLQ